MVDYKDILKDLTVQDNIVKLPPIQLDRSTYLQIKKHLECIGGKWNRKANGFVFKTGIPYELQNIKKGEFINLKKKYQFFETPEQLADNIVKIASIKETDRILEPSAGEGSLINAIYKINNSANISYYEDNRNRNAFLFDNFKHAKNLGYDFLKHDCINFKFDKIIANPPFSKNQDIDHVYKMYDCLKKGGRMVVVTSKHWQNSKNKKETEFRKWLNSIDAKIIDIPENYFRKSGTKIATLLIVIDKNNNNLKKNNKVILALLNVIINHLLGKFPFSEFRVTEFDFRKISNELMDFDSVYISWIGKDAEIFDNDILIAKWFYDKDLLIVKDLTRYSKILTILAKNSYMTNEQYNMFYYKNFEKGGKVDFDELLNQMEDEKTIDEKIEDYILEKQKNKQIKDTRIVKYTRKYSAAVDVITKDDLKELEKDNINAYKLVTKDNVWKPIDINSLKEQGYNSGSVYFLYNLRRLLAKRPKDEPIYRNIYIEFLSFVQLNIELAKEDFRIFANNIYTEFRKLYKIKGIYSGSLKDIFGASFFNLITYNVRVSKTSLKIMSKAISLDKNNWEWIYDLEKNKKSLNKQSPYELKNIYTEKGLDPVEIKYPKPLAHIRRTKGLEIPELNAQSILKYFGFKDVVFGNYIKSNEGREYARHFLAAMLDLSEILDIDIKQLNQLGGLSIAFGAMGCGGKAAACYYPVHKVINLTKRQGQGTIAHEWAHYLDNILEEGDNHVTRPVFLSDIAKLYSDNKVSESMAKLLQFIKEGNKIGHIIKITYFPYQENETKHKYAIKIYDTPEETIRILKNRRNYYNRISNINNKNFVQVYRYIATEFNKPITVEFEYKSSEFYSKSFAFETNPKKSYWTSKREMFARAFESYIQYKLKEQDRESNYLTYNFYEMLLGEDTMPYPSGDELIEIVKLFDELFDAIKKQYNFKKFTWYKNKRTSEFTEKEYSKNHKIKALLNLIINRNKIDIK